MASERLNRALEQIDRFSNCDYSFRTQLSGTGDYTDTILLKLNALGEKLQSRFNERLDKEQRINSLLDILLRYTVMDFSAKTELTSSGDEIDALGAGLNTLAEELQYYTEELKDREEQISTIFQHAPDAVLVIDSGGIINKWNPAAEKVFGWTEHEVIGKYFHDIIIPEQYRERHIEGVKHYFKTGEGSILNETIQLTALHKTRPDFDIELTISPAKLKNDFSFVAFIRDITKRKEAEEKAASVQKELELVLENLPTAIFVLNEQGIPFFSNKKSNEILGQSIHPEKSPMQLNELYSIYRVHTDEIYPLDQLPSSRAFLNHEFTYKDDLEIRKPGKEPCLVEAWGVPVLDENGKLLYAIVAFNEINTRKNIEKKIQELNDELLSSNVNLGLKNKELESFSYSVSHDLRAPLRAIHGYSQMLIEDYSDTLDREGNRLLNTVMSNAKKMGQLIDNLLEFSRLGKRDLKPHSLDLDELVNTVLNEISQAYNHRAGIYIGQLGKANGDEALIRHVFQNLILNAVKYSSKKENPRIEIGTIETKNGTAYFVKDNGAGFDMKYYDKLFGVFQRLHRQEEFEGTGVGLAIVQRIVLRHRGQLWAEGKVNEGAIFYFTLGLNT